jgi:uncharacterized protein with PIN domain
MTEVLSGIEEGDQVVLSGQFLLDSESQLQEAISKMLQRRAGRTETAAAAPPDTVYSCPMHPEVISAEPGRCPECGMDLEERSASPEELEQIHGEHSHEQQQGNAMLNASPSGQYSCPMHPQIVSDEPGRCSICGMFLERVDAESKEQP